MKTKIKKKPMIEEIAFNDRSGKNINYEVRELTRKAIRTALSDVTFSAGYQVSVSYVNAQEIRDLNARYRNVDEITDVLSFPMQELDARGVSILGDIVLCIDRAIEQAETFTHSLEREIAYLTVHSVLHLLGYDHEEKQDKRMMRKLEKRIMGDLQIFKG